MSWWPFSGASASAGAKSQAQPQSQPQMPSPKSISPPNSQSISPPPPPEAEHHDPDFYAAHPHLAPLSFSTSATSQSSTSGAPTTSSNPADEPLDPNLPRTMSCRAAFDSAFYCSSLGGHFNDLYRYGQLRSCNEHWNDFWFCMRVKNSYNPRETKERMVQDRYRDKEQKVKSGPSSEDVWRARGPGEEVVGAFGVSEKGNES
ncbi:hypothetical protein GQ44DRAFT_700024 [Phaeosphaeriaceae sp. PMI808]|nr:hypothetical protein GQ44DRAFT_700024 [Phaeosphaeriaceae sp. PMI808]